MPKQLPDGDEYRTAKPPKEVTHRFEAVMVWLLANPDKRIQDCAEALGYTPSWVSTVIHCDAFREKWIEMRGDYTGKALANIENKLNAIAHTALDKLLDQLETIDDPAFLLKTSNDVLKNLGYGMPSRGMQVNINPGDGVTNIQVVQDGGVLAQARAKRSMILEAEAQPQTQPALEAPKEDADESS